MKKETWKTIGISLIVAIVVFVAGYLIVSNLQGAPSLSPLNNKGFNQQLPYSKAEMTNILVSYAMKTDLSNYYTKAEVDNKLLVLNNSVSHQRVTLLRLASVVLIDGKNYTTIRNVATGETVCDTKLVGSVCLINGDVMLTATSANPFEHVAEFNIKGATFGDYGTVKRVDRNIDDQFAIIQL